MNSKTVKKKALPKGWREVRLGEVCFIDKEALSSKTSDDYCFEYVSLSDIEKGNLIQTREYKFSEAPSRARRIVKQGDVLLATVRPNLQGFYIFKDEVKNCIVSTGFAVLTAKRSLLEPAYLFQTLFGNRMLAIYHAFNVGSNYPAINSSDIHKFKVCIPSLAQQKAIAALLETWDTAIEKTEALIAAKEKRFKWLLKTLICDKQHKRNFVSFFATEISDRNRNGTVGRVLSVTNYNGFVLPEEQFERRVASTNLSNYKIVVNGQYGYNPSRINVGSIARLDNWDIGVLSPMYVVFGLNEEKINSDYFLHWLSSEEARQRIKNSAQGSVRETVSFNDFCLISIPVPPMEKQQRITEILNALKSEISLLSCLAEKYRVQKRGLMQKLLTGDWRVKFNQGGYQNG